MVAVYESIQINFMQNLFQENRDSKVLFYPILSVCLIC